GAIIPDSAAALFRQVGDLVSESSPLISGLRGITVGGDRGRNLDRPQDPAIPRTPIVHVANNRVVGFRQGIHIGLREGTNGHRQAYAVRVENNVVHLRVPLFSRGRHGVFVASADTVHVRGNRIEITHPEEAFSDGWTPRLVPATDGILLRGTFGGLVQIRENHLANLPTGIRFVTQIPVPRGAAWSAQDNASTNFGTHSIGL